jgi:P-type E1-E2 ATPase
MLNDLVHSHRAGARAAGSWEEVLKRWTEINVGDVLKVKDNELFPADLLCLHCDLDERICFVKTTNLDGETNLKVKRFVARVSFWTWLVGA